jgi:hypothetical protein
MPTRGRRSGGAGAAGLILAALCAQGCVSVSPWRVCEPPCGGRQVAEAGKVEVCKTDGEPILLTHARWGEDPGGNYIAGKAHTRHGQDLGDVRIYADQIQLVRTQRVEAGRVAANAVLVPLAVVAEGLTSVDFIEEGPDEPDVPDCPRPEATPTEPAPAGAPAPSRRSLAEPSPFSWPFAEWVQIACSRSNG